MDTIVEGPVEDGCQNLNMNEPTDWTPVNPDMASNNSTLLYIAIKMESAEAANGQQQQQHEIYSDFDTRHVSSRDPNMSSVAQYSPVYSDGTAEYNNSIVFVAHNSNSADAELNLDANSTLENIPTTVLCNNDLVNNQYMELVSGNVGAIDPTTQPNLQLLPKDEQEVELLITDEATGTVYSVSTQELLVERMDEQQLLESLNPDPLLDPDLLTLSDSAADIGKEDMIQAAQAGTQPVDSYIGGLTNSDLDKNLNIDLNFKMDTRMACKADLDDQLLSCVFSISDKPILSRARASLPETFLVINQIENENAVCAKKTIPNRAQFGPLEGQLVAIRPEDVLANKDFEPLQYFLEMKDGLLKLDVSDENSSNWMGFVRRAKTFEEQNLLLIEEEGSLYFTTTKQILPKQELKVGYSSMYAQKYKFTVLQPQQEWWPCYECTDKFPSSAALQEHLDIHDMKLPTEEESKSRKKTSSKLKKKVKKVQTEALECNICNFVFAQYNYAGLEKHLQQVHKLTEQQSMDEAVSIVINYICDVCEMGFKSELLLQIHNLDHDPDSSEEQVNNVCPACQRKFPTQRQLVNHVSQHALPKNVLQAERCKCPICYKAFSNRERLQKHMFVHGNEDIKPLRCDTCHRRFLTSSALACHLKIHSTGKKLFECPICNEKFEHVLKLKLHVPNHCVNNQYTCPHCNKLFKKYCVIRKHIRAHHCERIHSCTHCTKSFPTYDKLKMHLLRHSDHREFLCADCGKQFKRKDKLNEHCKRVHSEERENKIPTPPPPAKPSTNSKKFTPKVKPTEFHRFIYKCHACMVGFKRRGMLVNHLAKRHPDIPPETVPELNLPILQTTRDYYCQYCDKVYKSSSKRKAHILKNHPGAALPMSNRKQSSLQDVTSLPNPSFSQTVGSITTRPQNCNWCHKQYASKAKLLQHRRKKHADKIKQANEGLDGKIDEGKEDEEAFNDVCNIADDVIDNVSVMNTNMNNYKLEVDEEYCDISINDLESPNLYKLLTSSNGMLPPR